MAFLTSSDLEADLDHCEENSLTLKNNNKKNLGYLRTYPPTNTYTIILQTQWKGNILTGTNSLNPPSPQAG